MSQSNTVMAFRKRLKKRGYQNIRILNSEQGRYFVFAVEPLAGQSVKVEMTEYDMHLWR